MKYCKAPIDSYRTNVKIESHLVVRSNPITLWLLLLVNISYCLSVARVITEVTQIPYRISFSETTVVTKPDIGTASTMSSRIRQLQGNTSSIDDTSTNSSRVASNANNASATSVGTGTPTILGGPVIPFDPVRHKSTYKVGVLAIRGLEDAVQEFNLTFQSYLTETAGKQFDPPIRFIMEPWNFTDMYESIEAQQRLGIRTNTEDKGDGVDFFYVNPSAYSCIESEFTAHSLVSQISRRVVRNVTYDMEKFGGVIATRADNVDIRTIYDLRNKIVAAASISGLGSGQLQFLEMVNAGMSYLNDPKQLVFTSDQKLVVLGVLSGEFDVGFFRTDQMESTKDENGTLVDLSLLRVIHERKNLTIGASAFPFSSSTPLYPEWNVAALSHVPDDVNRAVQEALLRLSEFAKLAASPSNSTTNNTANLVISPEISAVANIAKAAMQSGKYAGWRTTLSYMQLITMQEAIGFISRDDAGSWKCLRANNLYEAVTCPDGYYQIDPEEFEVSCSKSGLECKEGYQCVCSPCRLIITCSDIEINGRCVSYALFLPTLILPIFITIMIFVYFYVEYKRKQADSVWIIKSKELIFENPTPVLGRGSYGLVVLAEYRGTKVAVKRVIPPDYKKISYFDGVTQTFFEERVMDDDLEMERTELISFERQNQSLHGGCTSKYSKLKAEFILEMRQLAKLRHPCITTVMGAVISPTDEPQLVMEYMEFRSLHEVLRNKAISIGYDQLMGFAQDIIQGLRFLHAADPIVIHGDLKARNVLVDSNFRAKVADFGLSVRSKVTASGSPLWMSPELLIEGKRSTASDVYAFGILVYEIFSRQTPFEGENLAAVVKQICDPVIDRRPSAPLHCPQKIVKLMQDCTRRNPDARPTAEQIDLFIRVETSVKERTSLLEALNKDLADANYQIASQAAMQLEHFASMSHEIRTPLSCILGISSILDDTELQPEQKESVSMIISSGKLLRLIVDDVLDYSKLESGNAVIEMKPTNLQGMISDSVRSIALSSVAQSKNLRVETHFDPALYGLIETDARRLQQILYNLLSNACKFSKPNGVVDISLDISPTNKLERELIDSTENCIRFAVTDYGKGIEKKDFESIFKPFHQTETGMNNKEGGTGLGLAITKKLVEALGGTIWVDSEVGVWTKFFLAIPIRNDLPQVKILIQEVEGSQIFIVSNPDSDDTQRLSSWFTSYQLQYTLCENMMQLEQNFDKFNITDQKIVCIVHGNLYDQTIFNSLKATSFIVLVTFGTRTFIEEAVTHFVSLLEIFPSTMLQNIADYIKMDSRLLGSGAKNANTNSDLFSDIYKTWRALIVDDNLINQKILTNILESLGMEYVKVAENGLIADEMESSDHFDIIFMDVEMPVVNGLEAWKLISTRLSKTGRSKPKLIFCTANVTDSVKLACEETGAGYLPKPITKDCVKDALNEIILNDKDRQQETQSSTQLQSESNLKLRQSKSIPELRVLVVDDNLVNQKVLSRILNRLGVVYVQIAGNGREAVEAEAANPFDVVYMDVQMPIMDGWEAGKFISERSGGHPKPKIIFCTAHVSDSMESTCTNYRNALYLPKPITKDSVADSLEKILLGD